MTALYNVFCKNRNAPLKIGSVKSNLGHTEPSSGICSIAKVILAMERGLIPPNIHFNTPRLDIEYFHTGEIEVFSIIVFFNRIFAIIGVIINKYIFKKIN